MYVLPLMHIKMDNTNQKHTNKPLLIKRLKRLAMALPLLIFTTYIFTFGFLNKEVLPLYISLTLGCIAMAATLFLLFNGFKIIMKSLF